MDNHPPSQVLLTTSLHFTPLMTTIQPYSRIFLPVWKKFLKKFKKKSPFRAETLNFHYF